MPDKIKDGTDIINLDEYSDIGTRWVALYVRNNDVTYFHSFGVEHIPKEIKTFVNNKNTKTNIGLAGTMTSDSILHINISEKTTDIGPPIGQPSTCFNNFSVTENTHTFVNLNKLELESLSIILDKYINPL